MPEEYFPFLLQMIRNYRESVLLQPAADSFRRGWQKPRPATRCRSIVSGRGSMSSDPASPLQVAFTPEFKRNLRQLAKKYRHIKSDLQPILDQLASGSKPGDQVPQVQLRGLQGSRQKLGCFEGEERRLSAHLLRQERVGGGPHHRLLENRASRYRPGGDPPDHPRLGSNSGGVGTTRQHESGETPDQPRE